jgi:hypothetical protein
LSLPEKVLLDHGFILVALFFAESAVPSSSSTAFRLLRANGMGLSGLWIHLHVLPPS